VNCGFESHWPLQVSQHTLGSNLHGGGSTLTLRNNNYVVSNHSTIECANQSRKPLGCAGGFYKEPKVKETFIAIAVAIVIVIGVFYFDVYKHRN
jgi:hypothetical protein